METNWNQLIERFLNGELSPEGKAAFEKELEVNKALQQELELHQLTQTLIKRAALRDMVVKGGKTFHLKQKLFKAGIVLAVAAAVATAVVLLSKTNSNLTEHGEREERIEQSLLNKMNKELQFENIDPQYFKFTGLDDVFLSETGVLLSITDQSFLLNGKPYSGEAIVQWQEAQTAAEIIKAGLSTVSGDKLLETQGMFSLNAFTPEGKKLELSKTGVYVQVPVDELKKDMMIFQGVKGENGNIDWQNPTKPERLPKPKSMAEIDLYPPNYEPKLNELKWFKEKTRRDSLYLSFDERIGSVQKDSLSGGTQHNLNSVISTFGYDKKKRMPFFGEYDSVTANYISTAGSNEDLGEMLFVLKCATCHSAHEEGTGPKLFNVRDKWITGGAKGGSIYQWVADWTKAANADTYVSNNITRLRPTAMPTFPELEGKTKEIDAIFDYIDCLPFPTETKPEKPHVPPSKVLAIWNTRFDGTILATQDFEYRMKAIHGTCDEKVFDVYSRNLNQPLWKLDEKVVKMGYPEFQRFADEHVGKLEISDAHQKNMERFYEEAIRTIRARGKEEMEVALKKESEWDESMRIERNKEVLRRGMRTEVNNSEEADFNLKYLSAQMGTTLGFAITAESFNNVPQDSKTSALPKQTLPIVVNIDRLTPTLLSSRQSLVVKNLEKDKQVTLMYADFNVKVGSYGQYDRLYFYLMPDKLNSYQRLDLTNGHLTYSLNSAVSYDGVLVGINEKGFFLKELKSMKSTDYGTLILSAVSESEFEKRINTLNSGRSSSSMEIQSELTWLFKEKENYVVQKKRRENDAFRAKILPTIYSCKNKQGSSEQRGVAAVFDELEEEIDPSPEIPAVFPGGMAALRNFIITNVLLPEDVGGEVAGSKVTLQLTVETNGRVSEVKVIKKSSNCPECDAEAVRLIGLLPDFSPATNNGVPVRSYFKIPVQFNVK